MLERRGHDRKRAFATGTVGHRQIGGPLSCVVRNLSDGGALLMLDEPRHAPVEITLALRGESRSARVVWRGEVGVGVAFASPASGVPASAVVVSLDDARRARAGDGGWLAERITRFVRRPGPA